MRNAETLGAVTHTHTHTHIIFTKQWRSQEQEKNREIKQGKNAFISDTKKTDRLHAEVHK